MPPSPTALLAVGVTVVLLLGVRCSAAEEATSPNQTTAITTAAANTTSPVIHTTLPDAVHPETGKTVHVLPVDFNVSVTDAFDKPVMIMPGPVTYAADIAPTPIFANASMRLLFDVPNPGLDFVLNLTSDAYPVLQDPNGTLWKSIRPSRIELVKRNSKYTYDVGNLSVASYQSQSESVSVIAGVPTADAECYTTKACCAVNGSYYRKYTLTNSPVPPYVCTGAPIPYLLRHFGFDVDSTLSFREEVDSVSCALRANEAGESVTCPKSPVAALAGITADPPYNTPSTAYALCREGSTLTNASLEASPTPVVATAFGTTRQCLGYTPANYRTDRSTCSNYPLGFFTSADGNNTNQFSYYESRAAVQWALNFNGCHWIDDVTMSSPSTITDMGFQCEVPESTGWSLTYANFSGSLTDTLVPLFPVGRATRISGRFLSPDDKDTMQFEVEYVSFSSFTGGSWTMRVCTTTHCATPAFPPAGNTGYRPSVMRANVSAAALHLPAGETRPPVSVEAYAVMTPLASPFRVLLSPSVIFVEPAAAASSQDTVNVSLARDPPERLPSPYPAINTTKGSRVLCQGDYRFSAVTNACAPLSDTECLVKYLGRRPTFDPVAKACKCVAPLLNGPLVYRPLPIAPPPRFLTLDEIRAMLRAAKVPQFLRSMNETFPDADSSASTATEQIQAAQLETTGGQVTAAAASDTSAADPPITYINESSVPGARALTITCIVLTCLLWAVALLRDVICKCLGVGPWRGQPPCAVVAVLLRGCQRLCQSCAKRSPGPQQETQEPAQGHTPTSTAVVIAGTAAAQARDAQSRSPLSHGHDRQPQRPHQRPRARPRRRKSTPTMMATTDSQSPSAAYLTPSTEAMPVHDPFRRTPPRPRAPPAPTAPAALPSPATMTSHAFSAPIDSPYLFDTALQEELFLHGEELLRGDPSRSCASYWDPQSPASYGYNPTAAYAAAAAAASAPSYQPTSYVAVPAGPPRVYQPYYAVPSYSHPYSPRQAEPQPTPYASPHNGAYATPYASPRDAPYPQPHASPRGGPYPTPYSPRQQEPYPAQYASPRNAPHSQPYASPRDGPYPPRHTSAQPRDYTPAPPPHAAPGELPPSRFNSPQGRVEVLPSDSD